MWQEPYIIMYFLRFINCKVFNKYEQLSLLSFFPVWASPTSQTSPSLLMLPRVTGGSKMSRKREKVLILSGCQEIWEMDSSVSLTSVAIPYLGPEPTTCFFITWKQVMTQNNVDLLHGQNGFAIIYHGEQFKMQKEIMSDWKRRVFQYSILFWRTKIENNHWSNLIDSSPLTTQKWSGDINLYFF